MFKFFKKEKLKKQVEHSVTSFEKTWNMNIHDIWLIFDKIEFILAMYGWVSRKCQYGKRLDALNVAEKAFYFVSVFESEINNGGISQFFYNSSGNLCNVISDALNIIKANNTAMSYTQLLELLMSNLPENRTERNIILDKLITDEVEERFDQFDKWFYENNDNFTDLYYSFIMAHKNQFE